MRNIAARSGGEGGAKGPTKGLSFGEDQLAIGGDSEAIILTVVLEDDLPLSPQRLAHLAALGRGGGPRLVNGWDAVPILRVDRVRLSPSRWLSKLGTPFLTE